jgi:cytidylate kinase
LVKTAKSKEKAIPNKTRKISVVISGMPSVGKTTAADMIAKRFGLRHIAGGDMLKEMAIENGYHPSGSDWWDSKEGMKFLADRKKDSQFDLEVDRRLIEYVRKGGVVITSYTVPWLCPDGLKIWFEAPAKERAKRLAGRDTIGIRAAEGIIKERDRRNRKLYWDLYKMKFGKDLNVFNYVIDTKEMNAEQVAETAARLVDGYVKSFSKNTRKKSN